MIIKYCNIEFDQLKEDGILDYENRKLAETVANEIKTYLLNCMSDEEKYQLALAQLTKGIPINKYTFELKKLQRFFVEINGIIYTPINTSLRVIKFGIDLKNTLPAYGASDTLKKVLIIQGLSVDGILRLQDIFYLFYHGNTFIHELIHHLDQNRINKDIKTVKFDGHNEREYFNSPKEFDAWSQEIFSFLETEVLDQDMAIPKPITYRWVYNFFNGLFKSPYSKFTKIKAYQRFLNNLTKQNKARFYNRLYNNFTQTWVDEYQFKDENSIEESILRKCITPNVDFNEVIKKLEKNK